MRWKLDTKNKLQKKIFSKKTTATINGLISNFNLIRSLFCGLGKYSIWLISVVATWLIVTSLSCLHNQIILFIIKKQKKKKLQWIDSEIIHALYVTLLSIVYTILLRKEMHVKKIIYIYCKFWLEECVVLEFWFYTFGLFDSKFLLKLIHIFVVTRDNKRFFHWLSICHFFYKIEHHIK